MSLMYTAGLVFGPGAHIFGFLAQGERDSLDVSLNVGCGCECWMLDIGCRMVDVLERFFGCWKRKDASTNRRV